MEYGSSFPATRAFGVVRSLYDTVYNMNLAHLTPGAQDGVRAPRRRRPAHRLHHLPDLPRPPPPRALGRLALPPLAEAAQFRHAVWGARELFYADLFDSRDTGCTPRSACPASATATPAAWAPTWWRTTCSTSCCSRCPTTTPTRTGRARRARSSRSPRPTARSSGMMHAAGGAEAFLERPRGDRDVRPLADLGRGEHRTWPSALGGLARAAAGRPGARGGRAGRLPRGALGAGVRARRGAPRASSCRGWSTTLRGARGRGPRGLRARTGEARRALASAGELRFAPGGELTDARGRGLERRGRRTAALDLERADGEVRSERLPRRARRGCGRRSSARTRATCSCRPRPATSSSTGAGRPRGRRQPRLAAPRRLAGRAADLRDRRRREREQWSIDGRDPAGARPLPCTVDRVSDEARRDRRARAAAGAHARARGHAQAAQLGAAGQVLRGRRLGLRGQPVRVRAVRRAARRSTTWWRPRSPSSWRWRTTSGGTATGRSARATGTPASRRARFFAVSVVAFLFAAAILELLVERRRRARDPAQAISIVAATPLNFVGNKMWSFAHRALARLRRGAPRRRARCAVLGLPAAACAAGARAPGLADRAAALLRAERDGR